LYYPVSILGKIFQDFPQSKIGILYDIGCQLETHIKRVKYTYIGSIYFQYKKETDSFLLNPSETSSLTSSPAYCTGRQCFTPTPISGLARLNTTPDSINGGDYLRERDWKDFGLSCHLLWPPFEFLLVFIVLMLSKPEAITILKD
jgi:hypothetical protein